MVIDFFITDSKTTREEKINVIIIWPFRSVFSDTKMPNARPSIGGMWRKIHKIGTFRSLKIIRARIQTPARFKMVPGE